MVAEQIKDKLEEILKKDGLLDRSRPCHIFDEFQDQDLNYYNNIKNGVDETQLMTIAKDVAERFGTISGLPFKSGANNTLFVSVKSGDNLHNIRLKGFNRLEQIGKNLQHVTFLMHKNQQGYNAAVGVGPSLDEPLYLVLLDGRVTSQATLERRDYEKDTDPLPKDLNEILDFIYSYSLTKNHIGSTEYVPLHLSLIEQGMIGRIERSKYLEDYADYWIDLVNKAITVTKSLVNNTPSTWVLSDAILENFIKVGNGTTEDKGQWTAIDQGYSEKQLVKWRELNGLDDSPETTDKSFYGRVEYNLGQLYFSLLLRENIKSHDKIMLQDRLLTLASEGIYNRGREIGIGKPRAGKPMPERHNPTLSLNYLRLGILDQVIADIARTGGSDKTRAYGEKLIYDIITNHPLAIDDTTLAEFMRGKSYLD